MSDSIIIPQVFFVGDYQMSLLFENLQFGFYRFYVGRLETTEGFLTIQSITDSRKVS